MTQTASIHLSDSDKIHLFAQNADGITLPPAFTYPFHYTPHPLTEIAAHEVQTYLASRKDWQQELHNGKMFGVLIVKTPDAQIGYLAAFSGNLAGSNSHPYFVPPVYDLLSPDGFFRKEEKQISEINQLIDCKQQDPEFLYLSHLLETRQKEIDTQLLQAKEVLKQARKQREEQRKKGISDTEAAEMVRESQFQKAEYKRLEKKLKAELEILKGKVLSKEQTIFQLKEERKKRSAALQMKLFEQFRMLNAKGETKDLCEIFRNTPQRTPPAGAGECALPKLLQYAYLHKLQPLAMGEFWWGISPKEEIRHHGHFYPSCKGKCEPILKHMLKGLNVEKNPLEEDLFCNTPLDIVYEDEWMVAVNKPAGMLSVPGKNDLDSVYQRLKRLYPEADGPLIVHRLDMATSGILLAAKTKEIHQALQELFISRKIKKEYIAVLKDYTGPEHGFVNLPLIPDWNNRPRQMVNHELGKKALTEFQVVRQEGNKTWMSFIPHTGRTHQLRVHAAHPEGLNAPILGDELYGVKDQRLHLHAEKLTFTHPVTNKEITITAKNPF